MSASHDEKYHDEPRLPTFEETLTEERLLVERTQLMEATKQLARLQLDMETKVRAEMEAKIRAEMEAKMRSEVARMEEERKAQEERLLLEEMKEMMRRHIVLSESASPEWSRIATKFIKTNAVIWYTKLGCFSSPNPNGYGANANNLQTVSLYLSEEHIALHIVYNNQCDIHEEIRPFYWFDFKLTQRDLSMLNNILCLRYHPGAIDAVAVIGVSYLHTFTRRPAPLRKWNMSDVNTFLCALHRIDINTIDLSTPTYAINCFQAVIRLIPGSYRNGSWRPLDGFFGPYLNEETLEITTMVPVLE